MMNRRMSSVLMAAVFLSCISLITSSACFASYSLSHKQDQIYSSPGATFDTNQRGKSKEMGRYEGKEEAYRNRRVSKLVGSRPPSCEHKCEGCIPCNPIQITTTTTNTHHLTLEYANYEPEGWKCKCKTSFFNP